MDEERLRARIEAPTPERGFSGVCLATADGVGAFSYATGLAHRGHRVPNTLATRFAIASVTKLITAAATLSLVDDGRLDLSTPLIDLLPPDLLPRGISPLVTTHHLLSHTSGITSYFDEEVESWEPFIACWDIVPTYHVRSPRDLVPLYVDKPAFAAPGGDMVYTNVNFVIAGLVCEQVTGSPFPSVVDEHVLVPAGMTSTTFDALDEDPADLAVGYRRPLEPGGRWRSNIYSVPAVAMPDGGMITTAHDLTRFIDALLANRLLAPATTNEMISVQAMSPSGENRHYGYGVYVTVVDGRPVMIGHGGSDPGINATVRHYLDTRTTIVVLANADQEGADMAAADVADLVADELGVSLPS